jgi:CO/xanthine dehydrogenase Mo-binding subunit
LTYAAPAKRAARAGGFRHGEEQIESAGVWALTAALYGKFSVVDGVVQESNFERYRMVRMSDAIFKASGKRKRSLPIADHDLRRS